MEKYQDYLLKQITKAQKKLGKIEADSTRKRKPNVKEIAIVLDDFYIFTSLVNHCKLLTYLSSFPLEISPNSLFSHTLRDYLSSKTDINYGIRVYNLIKILYEEELEAEEEKNALDKIERLLDNAPREFKAEDKVDVYSYLTNYCSHYINVQRGDDIEELKKRYFLYNNQILNHKYHLSKTKLSAPIFRNTVAIALNIEDDNVFYHIKTEKLSADDEKKGFRDRFEWTSKFIQTYQNKLPSTEKKTYSAYCQSLLLYKQSSYQEASNLLQGLQGIQGKFIQLHIYQLHLKILFELNHSDKDFLEEKKINIRRVLNTYREALDFREAGKKLLYQIKIYKNFDLIYRKLLNLHDNYYGLYGLRTNRLFQKDRAKILEEIELKIYAHHTWIGEQLKKIG